MNQLNCGINGLALYFQKSNVRITLGKETQSSIDLCVLKCYFLAEVKAGAGQPLEEFKLTSQLWYCTSNSQEFRILATSCFDLVGVNVAEMLNVFMKQYQFSLSHLSVFIIIVRFKIPTQSWVELYQGTYSVKVECVSVVSIEEDPVIHFEQGLLRMNLMKALRQIAGMGYVCFTSSNLKYMYFDSVQIVIPVISFGDFQSLWNSSLVIVVCVSM